MKIGPYDVGELIGEGGMGRVYRARDARLSRDVAIKVLPETFVADSTRVARFQREAQLLASLSHPNIGAIYGFEEMDSSTSGQPMCALVLELIEGPTLADRIAKGPLSLEDALPIARQIADALDAAHEKGIVHRDLKPSNIKLRPDGTVKVLDFGLAKMADTEPSAALSHSPTMLTASIPGMIVGTAAYMSPEQAKGQDAGRTADIWAFGCVLFEMLTGRPVFEGDSVSEVLASVLKTDPDWKLLPAETPGNIRRLLRRCLERDSKRRLQHIGDARIEIDDVGREPPAADAIIRAPRRREWIAWMAAASFAVAAVVIFALDRRQIALPVVEMRLEITTPPTSDPVSIAISPDASKIAFAAGVEGHSQLWLRSLDSVSARALPGTEGGRLPFWSPDSRSIGFFAEGKLKRLDVDGGAPRVLANIFNAFGGTWGRDDAILVAPLATGPIQRISVTGGDLTAVTTVAPPQFGHLAPSFLSDGRHFLYSVISGRPDVRGIYVSSLDANDARRLLDADPGAVVAAGHLLFVRQGTLFAQPFDPNRFTLSGTAVPIAEQTAANGTSTGISASKQGAIVYRGRSAAQSQLRFVWFDRSGKALGTVAEATGGAAYFSLSPDGRTIAMGRTLIGNLDVWLLDIARGAFVRLTSFPGIDNAPVWSPDGKSIVFESYAGGQGGDLYEKPVAGVGEQQLLLSTPAPKFPTDWSGDGRFVLFQSPDPKTGLDIWALPVRGDRKPFPVVRTDFDERGGQFSPDGKWIAYQSDESGRFEIYVQAFEGAGRKVPVSIGGGDQVRWRRDGQELFYVASDGRLMSVLIRIAPGGQDIEPGTPVPLFDAHFAVSSPTGGTHYLVAPDGQRFLGSTVVSGEANTSPVTVILNWKPKG